MFSYGSRVNSSESVPSAVRGVKGNTVSVVGMHVQSRLAERGNGGVNGRLRHSLLALCQCVP